MFLNEQDLYESHAIGFATDLLVNQLRAIFQLYLASHCRPVETKSFRDTLLFSQMKWPLTLLSDSLGAETERLAPFNITSVL